ncbi:MAG: 50S ribosomal protein L9 [Christensenellaceae bacterium]|nr:50S ribosomal protein L9 [Christensenellaceae bacterium]
MKVILLKDVKGTGKKNDVVNVSDGFARNFLIPKKFAVAASDSAINEINRKKASQDKIEAENKAVALDKAAELRDKEIVLKVKCGSSGRLYGAITTQEIANELKIQYDLEIDKRKIELGESIRQTGTYDVLLKLYAGISTKMFLKVEEAI